MNLEQDRCSAFRRFGSPSLVFVLAVLPYLGVLDGPFVFDDLKLVRDNQEIRDLGNLPAAFNIFSTTWAEEDVRLNYRPVPSAARCTCASWRNSLVTMTAVGIAWASRLTPSCIQHDVHEPQSPIAVSAMSLSATISANSAGAAILEKLSLA